jgi:RNA-binding protein
MSGLANAFDPDELAQQGFSLYEQFRPKIPEGVSPQFLAALDNALNHHELVKVKFDELKEQKKELAPQLAEKSSSHLVTRVGNVVVLYRPKPEEQEKQGEGSTRPVNVDLGSL